MFLDKQLFEVNFCVTVIYTTNQLAKKPQNFT